MQLFMLLSYRVSMVFLLWFVSLFLHRRGARFYNAGCFAASTLLDYLNFFVYSQSVLSWVIFTVLNTLLVQGTAWLCSEKRGSRALFIGVTAATFVLCGNTVSIIAYVTTQRLWLSLGLGILAHGLLLRLVTHYVMPVLQVHLANEGTGWGQLCVVPMLFYLSIYALYIWPGSIVENPLIGVGGILVLITMCACYAQATRLLLLQQQASERLRGYDALTRSAEQLRKEAEQLRKTEQKTAILRHDLRHQVQVLNAYLDEGQTDKLREALGQITGAADEAAAGVRNFCRNVAVNGALTSCAELAKKENVQFFCAADLPCEMRVNEFELSTVVANLTENAILAAAEVEPPQRRCVEVNIRPVKGQYLLEIENVCKGLCAISPQTGLPVSHRGEGHGYGLLSVSAFAEKYNALFDCETKQGHFCTRLLLNL